MRGLQLAGKRSPLIGLSILTALALVLAPTAAGAAAGDNRTASAACKGGGWEGLVDVNGREFRNQGQCVAAAVQGRLARDLNPQVSGPITGTATGFLSAQGCEDLFQTFDAAFTNEAGTGDLDIEGCAEVPFFIEDEIFPFSGSFTLTVPSGGSLTGAASGVLIRSGGFDLTLTVTTATGTLSGATGTLAFVGRLVMSIPGPGITNTITGTLTGQLG